MKRVGQRKVIPQKGFNAGNSGFLDMCAAINQYRIVYESPECIGPEVLKRLRNGWGQDKGKGKNDKKD